MVIYINWFCSNPKILFNIIEWTQIHSFIPRNLILWVKSIDSKVTSYQCTCGECKYFASVHPVVVYLYKCGRKIFSDLCVVCIQAVEPLSSGPVCHFDPRHYKALWGGRLPVGLGSESFIGISVLKDWRIVCSALMCVICNLFARSCIKGVAMHRTEMLKLNNKSYKQKSLNMQASKKKVFIVNIVNYVWVY